MRSLWPVPGERRTPLVLAEVELGPLVLVFAVARLRRGRLEVRPPLAPDGEPAVVVGAALRARIVSAVLAAVEADPGARAQLQRRN